MRRLFAVIALFGSLLIGSTAQAVHCGAEAGGLDCAGINGTPSGDDCTLSVVFDCTANTIINIPGTLTIAAGGFIDCSGTDGALATPGVPGFNLTINVGGDLVVTGVVSADGGTGGAGGIGQAGAAGAAGGSIDIDVCGDVLLNATSVVAARGGAGGPGGSAAGANPGGNGMAGGPGGSIDIDADLALIQASGASVDAAGGGGGAGGVGGTANGNGGAGANAGVGGAVALFSCATDIAGLLNATGGAGGAGGAGGGTTGDGGANGSGANAGTVTVESGSDLVLQASAILTATGGNEGSVGVGNPSGPDNGVAGNGGTVTTNNCPDFATLDSGATVLVTGGLNGGTPGSTTALETAPCCPCAIDIVKTVALDDNCDGTADGAFSDDVTQDNGECVVYQICVSNISDTGADPEDRPQVIENVLIDDTKLGIDDADFGDLAPGDEECRFVPSQTPATACDETSCICEDVVGLNTVVVDQAQCAVDASDACDETPPNPGPPSNCDDTANVACLGPCSVDIDKTVAPDDTCDGIPDGPFVDSVTQNNGECVIYRICVSNTGSQILNGAGVIVNDATIGVVNLNFGTLNPGGSLCQDIPTQAAAVDCAGGTCVCENVEGTNTAVITAAVCQDTQDNACDSAESDCDDTATVDCLSQECPLDHFKCYRTRPDVRFQPRDVTLTDQFETATATVERPTRLCNPANKNDEGIIDPTAHLMCYDIDQDGGFTPRDVLVSNQFGNDQRIRVMRPISLCNPATKDDIVSPLNLDHFKCYRVRRGTGTSINRTVTVSDQFESREAEVAQPFALCNPVDKNGEGIDFPACHLMCYRLRPGPPDFEPRSVSITDQFADQELNAFRGECSRVEHLCVPSSKQELD